ncbi:MAG TPA: HNH endonuclease signature motif containing protein [Streptosporangiaceae bacterium]|jgi:hypothetical protein
MPASLPQNSNPLQADVIADETSALSPELAAAVEQLVLPDAPQLTTTALRRRTRRAVITADPAAARQRVDKARRDARVERYAERSGGTTMLAGRDLPTAATLAADQRINATARDLKNAGVPATLAQLRAAVFLGLLNSTNPLAFLPPPGPDSERLAAWLARLKIGPIQAGECSHARHTPGYRIPATLDHLVNIRQQTCSNPICARPAAHCDDDHTLAHDNGGITCECDLGPACRKCHQAKQAPGWRLEQPRPGEFIWQPPHGRRYPATPDTYPT